MAPARSLATVAAIACLSLAAAAQAQQQGAPSPAPATGSPQAKTIPLPPFSTVSVCTPLLNVLIRPGKAYQVLTSSVDSVPIDAKVEGDQLILGTSGKFLTHHAVGLVVELPADALGRVAVAPLGGDVYVARGFAPASMLNLTSNLADARVVLQDVDLKGKPLNIGSSGASTFVLNGTFDQVNIDAGGSSGVVLYGAPANVTVALTGAAMLTMQGSAKTKIEGAAYGVNQVGYEQAASCQVLGPYGLRNACRRAAIASARVVPVWSCGVETTAAFTCPSPSAPAPEAAPGAAAAEAPAAMPTGMAPAPEEPAAAPAGVAPFSAESPMGQPIAAGGRRLHQAYAGAAGGVPVTFIPSDIALVTPPVTNYAGSQARLRTCYDPPAALIMPA